MKHLIDSYYIGERGTALYGTLTGLALVVLGYIVWRVADAGSLARGVAFVLIAFGALQASASGTYYGVLSTRDSTRSSATATSDAELRKAEVVRMRAVLQGPAYVGTLAFLSALLVIGLVLVLLMRERPQVVGIGLGLMFAAVIGHATEAMSMQKNRRHLLAVEAYEAAFPTTTEPPVQHKRPYS